MPGNKHLIAVPAQKSGGSVRSDKLTVSEVCAELRIAQSTFYDWRTKGSGPRCIKLPNGKLRVRRSDLEAWLKAREDAA
jgi:predicted DNA-binding transcriptional regulator AlpA